MAENINEESLPQYVTEFRQAVGNRQISEIAEETGIHRSTISNIYNNKVSNIDKVDPRSRKILWEKFKINSFYDPSFEPISENDDFSTKVKKYVLNNYDTINEAAKSLGVHSSTINNIFKGRKIKKSIAESINSKIRDSLDKKTESLDKKDLSERDENYESQSKPNLETNLRKIRDDLDSITSEIAKNTKGRYSTEILAQQYCPSLEQRISSIDIALKIIADEMDYFREASQEERNKLAQGIDIDNFGYIVNILGGISKGSGHETWARRNPPPTQSKQWRKRKWVLKV